MNFRKLLLTAALLLIGAIAPAQPRPPQRPMAPRRPAATAAPAPSNGSCARLIATPNIELSEALISQLSTDIHDHQGDPNTTRCATELAARLINAGRAPEAREYVNLLRRLPQNGTVYRCLDDVQTLLDGSWAAAPRHAAAIGRRLSCGREILTRATRLPTRCGTNLPSGLNELAYKAIHALGNICQDDPPGHPLMTTLATFNRPEDRELIRYWTEHRSELPAGIADAILIYRTREFIERGVPIQQDGVAREPTRVRDELRAYLDRTEAARTALYTEQTRPESPGDPAGRFVPTESDGIAAAGYLHIGMQLTGGLAQHVNLGNLLLDIAWTTAQHLFEDERTRFALLHLNATDFTGNSLQGAALAFAEQVIAELPNDGAHLSLTKLRLRWIVATRRIEGDVPSRLSDELNMAYRAFQPEGENTPHPGLPREVFLQTLLAIAEQGLESAQSCRSDGCSSSTPSHFQEQLRWLRPAVGQPVGSVAVPSVRTVSGPVQPAHRR